MKPKRMNYEKGIPLKHEAWEEEICSLLLKLSKKDKQLVPREVLNGGYFLYKNRKEILPPEKRKYGFR